MSDDVVERKPTVIDLEAVLNPAEAQNLRNKLIENRENDIVLNADNVRHLGAQSLAVIMAASKAWPADSQTFSINQPSDMFREALMQMGVPDDTLTMTGDEA